MKKEVKNLTYVEEKKTNLLEHNRLIDDEFFLQLRSWFIIIIIIFNKSIIVQMPFQIF